jgi:hypothetical protein
MTRARWVHPDTHAIFKFLPHNPPERGNVVLVDGERHRVLRCPIKWDGRTWSMGGRGVKVRPIA